MQALVAALVGLDAVLIPFGGGSNIAGSLEPIPAESRVVVSVDLGRLDRLIDIDEASGLARIQAGALGPVLEAQLNERGWTIGHFPDSFTHSTLGGWVATRSSGMQSDKYGDIADIARGMRVARPNGLLDVQAYPSASTGPSVRELILGSEGRLGVITEVDRAGAPRAGEARHPRLLLPELDAPASPRCRPIAGERHAPRPSPGSPTPARPASRSPPRRSRRGSPGSRRRA